MVKSISLALSAVVPISSEGKDGQYANGYDVQIAQYIANKLGMKLEIYAMEWDSLIPAVQSGTVDAIAAGMSPTVPLKIIFYFLMITTRFDS